MARSTFKVLFYLKRQSEQNGKAPIMGRITINGTISQFSCKMSVSPALWDTKANKAAGKSIAAQRINEKLENIKTNIGKQYQRICDRDSYVTAEKVKNAWLGFGDGYQLLIETFDAYLKDFEEKRAGKDRAIGTLICYRKARNYLAAFLRYEYKIEDIPFKELKREFIERYVVYLSTVRRMLPGSIHTPVKKLKLMTYTAFKNGWITTDPFSGFRISVTYRDRRFLSESELQVVMNVRLPNYKTVIVRDIFVFCLNTGLAYADIKQLHPCHIGTTAEGRRFIRINRKKTGVEAFIPLHPIAEQILSLYNTTDMHSPVFPLPSRDSIWHEIREIGVILGRHDDLSYHQARHGFGVLLISESVSIESIAKMMGHSNISTTQGYARITEEKISREMDRLMEKRSQSRTHSGSDSQ